jgi:hypothetical protein
VTSPHWLPDPSFDVSTLTRRQAAVFAHLCIRARAGLAAEIRLHESMLDRSRYPLASDRLREDARRELRDRRAELGLVAALQRRLERIHTAPLSPAEQDRLAEARRINPDLSGAEATAVIYGQLDPASLERRAA